ncbi:hypothetical protein [Methylobacillus glycogenes]|uniref:hypothetical protein n=1 Tax=Methylobacillus glycogenes TaxID=406 RepID=UPI00046FA6D6|nr:hypothetical protein [Methylobacillus glycogenes]
MASLEYQSCIEVEQACNDHDLAWAKAQHESATGPRVMWFAEWIHRTELASRDKQAQISRDIEMRAIKCASDAALAAQQSAKWTMWAAVAAAAGVLVPIVNNIISWWLNPFTMF